MKKFDKEKAKQKIEDFWAKHGDACIGVIGALLVTAWTGYACDKSYKLGQKDGFGMGAEFGSMATCDILAENYPKENVDTAIELLANSPEKIKEYFKRFE